MKTLLIVGLTALALPAATLAQEAPVTEDQPASAPAPRSAKEANLQAAPQPSTTTREPGERPAIPIGSSRPIPETCSRLRPLP